MIIHGAEFSNGTSSIYLIDAFALPIQVFCDFLFDMHLLQRQNAIGTIDRQNKVDTLRNESDFIFREGSEIT